MAGILVAVLVTIGLLVLAGLVERGFLTRIWRRGAAPSDRPLARGSRYEPDKDS